MLRSQPSQYFSSLTADEKNQTDQEQEERANQMNGKGKITEKIFSVKLANQILILNGRTARDRAKSDFLLSITLTSVSRRFDLLFF